MVIGEESQASRKAENNGLRDLLDTPSRLWGEGYSHRRTKRLRVEEEKRRRLALPLRSLDWMEVNGEGGGRGLSGLK